MTGSVNSHQINRWGHYANRPGLRPTVTQNSPLNGQTTLNFGGLKFLTTQYSTGQMHPLLHPSGSVVMTYRVVKKLDTALLSNNNANKDTRNTKELFW